MKRRRFIAALLALAAAPVIGRAEKPARVWQMATGGFVDPKRLYFVGERGPEHFKPIPPVGFRVTCAADGTLLTWQRPDPHDWRGTYITDGEGYKLQRPYSIGDPRLAEWARRVGKA